MISKFRIGDRVEVIGNHCQAKIGMIGIICNFSGMGSAGIRFDEEMGGHDCDGNCETGYGQYVQDRYLKLISPRNKLINVNMDIEDINGFPKDVLVKAEKEAREDLVKEQGEIAKTKFKELFIKISEAEKEVEIAKKKLNELKGKMPKKKGRPVKKK